MSSTVTGLTPNIETAEDFNRIGQQLSDIALDYLNRAETPEPIPYDELKANLDAIIVWKEFGKAFRRGRGLFMTWEEIRRLLPLSKLNNTLEFMLSHKFLKEIQMELPPTDAPLCPFCYRPYAYPIKTKRLLFLTRISAWSCANDSCRMYGQSYNLRWY